MEVESRENAPSAQIIDRTTMPHVSPGRLACRLACFVLLAPMILAAFPSTASADGSILIGEVAWAGSSLSTADEWLELWNLDDQPVDLTGYLLVGAGGANGIPLAGTIGSQSAFVVANYPADDSRCSLAIAPDVVTSTVSLSNDKVGIRLVDPGGTIVDAAGNGNAPPAGASGSIKISMLRRDVLLSGDDPAAWQDATTTKNLDPNIPDLATPGFCDGCALVASSTSTQTDLPPIDASSTLTVTSSTEETPPIVDATSTETASSTIDLFATTSTETPEPILTATTTEATADPPLPIEIRLREIDPNPSTGPEAIDLILFHATDTQPLIGWDLMDAQSAILHIATSTVMEMRIEDDALYVRIPLPGHHLNNDGDTVVLRNALDEIMDHTAYPALNKDERWSRGTYGDENWHITGMSIAQNSVQTTPVIVATTSPPPVAATTTTPIVKTATATKPVASPPKTAPTKQTEEKKQAAKPAATKTAAKTTTRKTTAKKTTTKTATKPKAATANPPPVRITFDDMTTIEPSLPLRVSIRGVVGTVPGLISRNQFVILNPDGRGLLVKGNGKQPSPPLNANIEVAGSLVLNDLGLSLNMATKDRWTGTKKNETATPRIIDLATPDQEDAWSLVATTGTVADVKPTRVTIDTGDAELLVQIKPIIKYRAERLLPGDTITVRGIIDTRADALKLYPRQAEDIVLVSHAPPKTDTAAASQVPPWSPIAAAGGTLALGEGYKRIKKIREHRRLKKLLTEAGNALIQNN